MDNKAIIIFLVIGLVAGFLASFIVGGGGIVRYLISGVFLCSGSLINDARDSGRPFFLSAFHCDVNASNDQTVVVFWNSAYQSALAYRTLLDGTRLSFLVRDGRIVDAETQSEWRIDGVATSGPLVDTRLEPVAEAYVAFWFAWAAFHPQTRVWEDT